MLGEEFNASGKFLREMKFFVTITSILAFFLFPHVIFASPYGSGAYGDGLYGVGSVTATPSPAPSNSSPSLTSSVNNAVSTFFCMAQAPSSSPLLFEVDASPTTAKIFFTPASGPADSHVVSFGLGNQSEGYGVSLAQGSSQGAIPYTINELTPNTFYTIKVRGGNGCKPGDWSNTLTIKTQAKGIKKIVRFYPTKQANSVPPQKNISEGLVSRIFPQSTQTPITQNQPEKKVKIEKKLSIRQVIILNKHHLFGNLFQTSFLHVLIRGCLLN